MRESPKFIRPLLGHVKLGIQSVLGGRQVSLVEPLVYLNP